MAVELKFDREYADFGPKIREFEKADDVGYVATEFLWYEGAPFYPIGDLMEAPISAIWLGEEEAPSEELIDLVFRMPTGGDESWFFYEIVLRTKTGAVYGGFAAGETLRVLEEIVNGHRILEADFFGQPSRYVYEPTVGRYQLSTTLNATALRVRQLSKRRR